MECTIRPATRSDAYYMACRLRFEDAREIRAASGQAPVDILPDCIVPGKTYVLQLGRSPIAMFGVTTADGEPTLGFPWMVATPALVYNQFYFLRNCRKWIDTLSQGYTLLTNCVDARNELHIKWLKWCGFTFTQLHPEWGAEKLPFWQFEKHITNV